MASEDDLKKIIEQMRAQGISDEDIRATLRDMGVDEALVNKLLGGAGTTPSAPAPTPPPAPAPETPPEKKEEPEELPEISTLAAVEVSSKVEELTKKVNSLHEKLDTTSIRDDLLEIKEELKEIKQELSELKGMLNGFRKILQQILDTGRSILVEIKNR